MYYVQIISLSFIIKTYLQNSSSVRLILSEKIKKKMMALVVYDFYVFSKIDLSSVYNFTASLMIDDNINSFSSTIQFNSIQEIHHLKLSLSLHSLHKASID